MNQPIHLTPNEVRVLAKCPLHYHFLQQKRPDSVDSDQVATDRLVRDTIQNLHAAGGPGRLSLRACLQTVQTNRAARQMVERYYRNLERDWADLIASNETMQLRISLGGVSLNLAATIDRLDKTSDGGILAILFRTDTRPPPTAASLRRDHSFTIYHSLVAATYPLKRPVRLQELWLRSNESVTIELSEDEYRRNLSDLREPVQGLARSEVMARPGLHCDTCAFKYHGCPVYAHEVPTSTEAPTSTEVNILAETSDSSQDQQDRPPSDATQADPDNFAPSPPDGKIPRKWVFKI